MENLFYVKDYHLPIFATEKPDNKSDVEWTLIHRQVCGYIRQWVNAFESYQWGNICKNLMGQT